MLPLLRTKKVMKTSSYRFKQRLWLFIANKKGNEDQQLQVQTETLAVARLETL